jgi:hypothetical protein
MTNSRKITANDVLRIALANPDVSVPTLPNEPKTPARKDLDAEMRKNFAATFEANWRLCGGPELETEHYFNPDSNHRNDYLHRPTMTLIELEGGVYTKGRHVRPVGFVEDCVKYNLATMMGYRLIRIPTGFATPHYLRQIIDWLKG